MSTWTFLTAFARDPVRIGAIAPSGRALARLEVQAADIRPGHSVVELGAGTGPMTAELVRRHPDAPLLVLEPDATLAALLREKFPDLRIEERFAQALPELVADWGHGPVDRVVSSLPWAIWPETLQTAVFDGIHAVLASDARLVTFTYAHTSLLPAARRFRALLAERFCDVTATQVAWANLPPAYVYVCDRPRDMCRHTT